MLHSVDSHGLHSCPTWVLVVVLVCFSVTTTVRCSLFISSCILVFDTLGKGSTYFVFNYPKGDTGEGVPAPRHNST